MTHALTRSLVVFACALSAAKAADVPLGKRIFEQRCAECHADTVGTPGTQQLGWTRGKELAVLERRKDLHPDFVRHVVRNGLLEMPPFRPTEIDDAQLQALIDYLTHAPAAPRKAR